MICRELFRNAEENRKIKENFFREVWVRNHYFLNFNIIM